VLGVDLRRGGKQGNRVAHHSNCNPEVGAKRRNWIIPALGHLRVYNNSLKEFTDICMEGPVPAGALEHPMEDATKFEIRWFLLEK
jgi:hypothetical protein